MEQMKRCGTVPAQPVEGVSRAFQQVRAPRPVSPDTVIDTQEKTLQYPMNDNLRP